MHCQLPPINNNLYAQQQQTQLTAQNNYISDLTQLMNTKGLTSLYFAVDGELVRLRYSSNPQLITLDVVTNSAAGKELREILPQDTLRSKLTGNFDSNLIAFIYGNTFGANPEDQYSRIGETPRFGNQISNENQTTVITYLDNAGKLLKN